MTVYQVETLNGQKTYMSFAKTPKSDKLIEIYDRRIMVLFKSGELQKMYEKWDIKFAPEAWKE
ncbi:MAG: hypothetical protein HC887_00720 [Desulfobacteraceae bacterium]|nr:hypothetical protein [Desulfobacteraceae bacterium]